MLLPILLIVWLCAAQVPFWLYLLVAVALAVGILGERRIKDAILESEASDHFTG